MFPKKIRIPSDNTELELQGVENITSGHTKGKSNIISVRGRYLYTKAEYFLNSELFLSQEAVDKMIRTGTAFEIKL